MLKILFATDPHLRASKPASRLENDFFSVQLKKLEFVGELSKKADITILGGDIFDRPDVPYSVLLRAIQCLSSFCPYTVIGNHDIFGYQGRTVEHSAIGVLLEVGAVKRLDYLSIRGVSVFGVHAFDTLVPQVNKDVGELAVMVAHKMITDKPIPNAGCILVDTLAQATNADVVLSGDIHTPHEVLSDGKLFLNPGSLSRLSIVDRDRSAQVVMVTIGDDKKVTYELIPVPCEPADKAFNLKDYASKAALDEHSRDFAKTYATAVVSVKAESHKVGDQLNRFLKEQSVPEGVKKVILSYHTAAESQLLKNVKEE